MSTRSIQRLSAIGYLLLAIGFLLISACSHPIPRFGIGGRYQEGREQFLRGRGGDMDRAIIALESVVRQDPTYRDSLTLLARAYYRKERYQDAYMIVQRALAVNKDDEIAWLVLGLAQLRLGEGEKGLQSLKQGLTLLIQVSKSGYRNFTDWDSKDLVRASTRRAVHLASKGLEAKEDLTRVLEILLSQMDAEENFHRVDSRQEHRRGMN